MPRMESRNGSHLGREEALAVHAAVDLEVHAGLQAGAAQAGQKGRHVVADHGEVHALSGPSPRTGRSCRGAHDQDAACEPGVAKSHRLFGRGHRHPMGAGRQGGAGHRQGAVAVAVGLDGHQHAAARGEQGAQVGHVVADGGQVYEYAASRRGLHRSKANTPAGPRALGDPQVRPGGVSSGEISRRPRRRRTGCRCRSRSPRSVVEGRPRRARRGSSLEALLQPLLAVALRTSPATADVDETVGVAEERPALGQREAVRRPVEPFPTPSGGMGWSSRACTRRL